MKAVLLRVFGVLLMLSALALTLAHAPDRQLQTLVARWAPPPSDFVDVEGQVVHLRDQGPRSDLLPVVLIHGASASLHTWEGWARSLQRQRRVITLDLPGFGLTGPNTSGVYGGDGDARFVLDVLDALQVRRFVIGGNSLGGEVAWRTAWLARERVERLILVDSTGLPMASSGSVPLAWRIARVPVLDRLLEEVLPRSFVEQALASVYGHPERITPELVDRYFEITLREGNRRALAQRLRQFRPGADAERLQALRLPTLILWGGRDRLIAPAAAQRFQAAIPGSTTVVFDDLGHVPQEEDAERSLVPVREFLGLR